MNDLFSQAKAAVSLLSFLTAQGFTVRALGKSVRSSRCPKVGCEASKDPWKLSVMGGLWRCWKCGSRGDVVQAASLIYGVSARVAASKLIATQAEYYGTPMVTLGTLGSESQQAAMAQVVSKLVSVPRCSAPVQDYFWSRGIDGAPLADAMAAKAVIGLLDKPSDNQYFLEETLGKSLMIEAGLMSPNANICAMAYRPLLICYGNSFEARSIDKGALTGPASLHYGQVTAPFTLVGKPQADCVTITNGAIDAMSLRALGCDGTIMGLPSEVSWHSPNAKCLPRADWFSACQGKAVRLAFRQSEPGQAAQAELTHALNRVGIETVAPWVFDPGCDANDALRRSLC